jgi:hypothetical protein
MPFVTFDCYIDFSGLSNSGHFTPGTLTRIAHTGHSTYFEAAIRAFLRADRYRRN